MNLNSDRLRLEIKRARVPFVLYLGLVGIGLFAFWGLYHNLNIQWPWDKTRVVRAEFDNVKGVAPGKHEVRIAGVKVGVIKDAEAKDGKAIVSLSLNEEFGPVYKNARMRLRPVTPLQDMYISIESRGDAKAGELKPGDLLKAQSTETPVDISRVLNTFDPDTRTRLAGLLTDMGKGFGDQGEELRRAFASAAPFLQEAGRLTKAIADRRTSVARVVHNLGNLTAALNTRDRQLTSLVSVGNDTLGELAQHDAALSATLGELPSTLARMRSAFAELRSAQTELDPTLRSLKPVTDTLKPGLDALKEVSDDAVPALDRLQPAVKRLRPLARDLQPTSLALSDSLSKLAPTLPRVDSATKKITRCYPTTQKFFQWTPSVFKFYDNKGVWPRGELLLGIAGLSLGTTKDPILRAGRSCIDGGPDR